MTYIKKKVSFPNKIIKKIRFMRFNFKNIKNFLLNPLRYIKSYKKENKCGSIGVIMCVFDEQDNILEALISSIGIGDFYYIIDKNGNMWDIIYNFFSFLNKTNYYYEVCENLNLIESRKYALSLVKEDWVFIQDGDEIILFPKLIRTLTNLSNVCYQTKMVTKYYVQPFHTFLFPKNSLYYFEGKKDIPLNRGRYIRLREIIKENRAYNKSDYRLTYRNRVGYKNDC